MKRFFLPVMLAFILCLFPRGYAQERADMVESITPAPVMLFAKTSRIKNCIGSVRFVASNLLSKNMSERFNKKLGEIKAKTGIDPLDIESLINAGIDVERTISLALYPPARGNEDRIVLFVPVKDEKTFPLKFVEILKKMSGNENLDLYPVITEYGNHTIYQIHKDIFSTAFDGVFILASTGELIQGIVNVRNNNSGYLSLDPMYVEYLSKSAKDYDLRAFMSRDFLKNLMRYWKKTDDSLKKKKDAEPKKQGTSYTRTFCKPDLRYVAYADTGNKSSNGKKSETDSLQQGASLFNAVDYASLGVRIKPANLLIDLAVKFNNTSAKVNTFLDIIRTGVSEKALSVRNPATFVYVSIDCNKIEELCREQGAGCIYYAEFKDDIRKELGVDFEKDFVPYYSGVVNIIANQPKGSGGGYCIFFPMNDQIQSKRVRDTIAAHLEKKYKGSGRFGNVTIGAAPSLWYLDSSNSRIYLALDHRGIYIGNDTDIINTALSSGLIKDSPAGDALTKRLDPDVFSFASIKKESFFGALLMLQAYKTKEIGRIVEKMTDLYLIGKKRGRYVSLDIIINLSNRK